MQKTPLTVVIVYNVFCIFTIILTLKKNMKLFKKKTAVAASKAKVTPLDKNQLETVIGGSVSGGPIGGVIVKAGKNPGGGSGN